MFNKLLSMIPGVLGEAATTEETPPPSVVEWSIGDDWFDQVSGTLYYIGDAISIIGGAGLLIWSVPKVISMIMGQGNGGVSKGWIIAALILGALLAFNGAFGIFVGVAKMFSTSS